MTSWMSFTNQLSQLYSGAKQHISELFSGVKKTVDFAKGSISWLDEQLGKASTIPFIGGYLDKAITKAKTTQIGGYSYDDLKLGLDVVSEFLDSDDLQVVGKGLDDGISLGLTFLQQEGAKLDIAAQQGPVAVS